MATPPKLSHVLETILYTRNQEASREFYKNILGLEPAFESPRGTGYPLGNTMLLIFTLGLTTEDQIRDESAPFPEGLIPKHGPSEPILDMLNDDSKAPETEATLSLRQHYCLSAEMKEEVNRWEEYLKAKGVEITGKM